METKAMALLRVLLVILIAVELIQSDELLRLILVSIQFLIYSFEFVQTLLLQEKVNSRFP